MCRQVTWPASAAVASVPVGPIAALLNIQPELEDSTTLNIYDGSDDAQIARLLNVASEPMEHVEPVQHVQPVRIKPIERPVEPKNTSRQEEAQVGAADLVRLGSIESAMDRIEGKIEAATQHLVVGVRLDRIENRVQRVEDKMDQLLELLKTHLPLQSDK